MSGALLSGAVLSGAVLSGAFLSGAFLSGALLSGAFLSGNHIFSPTGGTTYRGFRIQYTMSFFYLEQKITDFLICFQEVSICNSVKYN